jgi:hypothetical protein
MPQPQRTLGRNFVILIDHVSLTLCADESVRVIQWISGSEYRSAGMRERFTHYEQQFLDALFYDWEKARSEKLTLKRFS